MGGKRLFQCFLRVNYLTFCNSASVKVFYYVPSMKVFFYLPSMKVVQQWNPIRPVFIVEDAVSFSEMILGFLVLEMYPGRRRGRTKILGALPFSSKDLSRQEKRWSGSRVHPAPGIAAARSPSTFALLYFTFKLYFILFYSTLLYFQPLLCFTLLLPGPLQPLTKLAIHNI